MAALWTFILNLDITLLVFHNLEFFVCIGVFVADDVHLVMNTGICASRAYLITFIGKTIALILNFFFVVFWLKNSLECWLFKAVLANSVINLHIIVLIELAQEGGRLLGFGTLGGSTITHFHIATFLKGPLWETDLVLEGGVGLFLDIVISLEWLFFDETLFFS